MSYAAQAQVLEYFAPAFSASAGPFATATGSSILSLSCPPSTLAHVVEYIAPAPAVYAAPAPVMVYLALAQTVSYAAQTQVLEYFAPASSASAGPSAAATGLSFSPCRAHRLHLHLWWSTLRRHHNGMLHRACLNVHRANWDARAQFLF